MNLVTKKEFGEKQAGMALLMQYVPPRKRKARHMTFSGESLEETIKIAREWREINGGNFISGCSFECVRFATDYQGDVVWMCSINYGSPTVELTEFQMIDLNLELTMAVV